MGTFRQVSATRTHRWKGKHRFEHWYRDNTVYFITSKVRDGFHAFREERAKQIFWDRFDHWSTKYDFKPWGVSLLDNHYHILGFLPIGENLGHMMQKLHGSTSKLVNDTLPERHVPFWRFAGHRDYFDGCLRDETQLRRAYHYVQRQAVRAGLVRRVEDYPHTRTYVTLHEAVARAKVRDAYLPTVPYARYDTPSQPAQKSGVAASAATPEAHSTGSHRRGDDYRP